MQYFDYQYDGPPFELFGTGHLLTVAIVASILAFFIWGWRNPSEAGKRRARYLILAVFAVAEVSWHA